MRTSFAAIAFLVMGCAGGEDTPSVPASMLVVDDSTGRVVSAMVPSPDGSRIAYTRVVGGGRSQVFVSALDGSNAVQVSHGVWDVNPVWSPDGKWIAFQGEDPDFDLYVASSDGSGTARIVSGGPGVENPIAWRNDSTILFLKTGVDDDHPMVVSVAGGTPQRVGPVMQGNMHAMFSPDGTQLAWDVHQGEGATIWVQDLKAGTAPRQLTTEGMENGGGTGMWSPDGKQLVYTSRRTGTDDIWIVDVASGQTRQLTNDVRNDVNPRWSPDGRLIAFGSDRGGQRDLWVMPSAGGDAVRLTNDPASENGHRWSVDGKTLYYLSEQTAVELQMVPVAGGAARTVRAWEEFLIGAARLSPDGKTIVYNSPLIGNGDLFLLSVDGGEPTPFATSALAESSAQWSPDGTQIAFLSVRGGSTDIWVAPVAGGEARNLTSSPGNESEPFWSPDGKQIAYRSTRDAGSGDLWVISSSGGTPTRLTRSNIKPGSIQWSPDGQFIYFTGSRPGSSADNDYYRVRPAGGRVEALGASPQVGNGRVSRDGTQIAFTTYERGWAFTNVMPSAGGPSRRITIDTTSVYQPGVIWSRGDSLLIVTQLDLQANRDYGDLFSYRFSDGRWQRLTETKWRFEETSGITPEGNEVLVVSRGTRDRIKRVNVPELKAPE